MSSYRIANDKLELCYRADKDKITNHKFTLCSYIVDELQDDFMTDLDSMSGTLRDDHIVSMTKLQESFNTQINDYKKEIQVQKDNDRKISQYIKDLFVIRQYTNDLFNTLYNDSQADIDLIVLDYNQIKLQRPNVLEQHTSVKYALCILYTDYKGKVSKELCEMYLKLNDMCHPKTKPAKDKVIKSINSLEDGFKSGGIPSIFEINKLSYNNLEELRKLVNH